MLDRFAADGYDLLLCGHTHGGQLRVPFYGALVTNCGIDRDRVALAAPLGRRRTGRPAGTWLHVSAGPRHQPVRAGPLRLPARGDAAHADRPRRLTSAVSAPTGSARPSASVVDRHLGVWRSLVARVVRDDEAAGSNPVTPTPLRGRRSAAPESCPGRRTGGRARGR